MDFEQFYQDKYPAGIPREIDLNKYKNMVDVFEQAVKKYGDRPAFSAVGATLTYKDLDTQSRNFAAWLQNKTDLKPGDRMGQAVWLKVIAKAFEIATPSSSLASFAAFFRFARRSSAISAQLNASSPGCAKWTGMAVRVWHALIASSPKIANKRIKLHLNAT